MLCASILKLTFYSGILKSKHQVVQFSLGTLPPTGWQVHISLSHDKLEIPAEKLRGSSSVDIASMSSVFAVDAKPESVALPEPSAQVLTTAIFLL